MYHIGAETVRGTIIGQDEQRFPYQFWTVKTSPYPLCLPPHKFADGWFSDDEEAEKWCIEHYPEQYADGIEMRVFLGG